MPDAPDSSLPSPSAVHPRFRIAFTGMLLVLGLASLDNNIVGTALPRIVSDLGGLEHLSWVVTAFMIAATATTPLYGKLSDMYGRRPLLFVAVLIFLTGSALCGLAQSMFQLIVFRALQGLGSGGLIVLVQAAIGDLVPARDRGRYQGMFAAVFGIGSVGGPLVGGIITDALSWRWIFYVNLPVGAAALALIAIGVPRSVSGIRRRSIDYAGALLLTSATSSAMLAMTWGGTTYPWSSPVIIGLAGAAIGLTAVFLMQQRVAPEPILPLHLFSNRTFKLATGAMALAFIAIMSTGVFLPLFFQLVRGASPSSAGIMTAPLMAGLVTSSFVSGRLVSRSGRYRPFPIIGLAIASTGYLSLTAAALLDLPNGVIMGVLVLIGSGLGMVMPNLTVAVQNAVDRRELGVATSTSGFVRSLGGSFGVALAGALLTATVHRLIPGGIDALAGGLDHIAQLPATERHAIVEAYRYAIAYTFLCGAIAAVFACAIAFRLPEIRLGDKV